MRKPAIVLGLGLVLALGLVLQAAAFDVILDTDSAAYAIDKISGHDVKETYTAANVVGPNVIDTAAQDPFFDVDLVFSAKDAGKKHFEITWKITNDTGVTWTDYHLVMNPTNGAVFTKAQSADFKTASFTDFTEDFSGGAVAPGEVLQLNIALNLGGVSAGEVDLRQIATAAAANTAPMPLPGAAPLLGTGLVGLVGWRRFRKG